MTQLLERAISLWEACANAQLKTLSEAEQDAIASRLLAEMADDLQWQAQFISTTDQQWDQMAAIVRQEIDSSPVRKMSPIKRGKTGQDLLKLAGTWRGDDLEDCLKAVRGDRSQSQF
jgi:hypothetical protein